MDPAHGRVSVGRPTRIYMQQLCIDTDDLLESMDDKEE